MCCLTAQDAHSGNTARQGEALRPSPLHPLPIGMPHPPTPRQRAAALDGHEGAQAPLNTGTRGRSAGCSFNLPKFTGSKLRPVKEGERMEEKARKPRRGSEQRVKQARITFRVAPNEHCQLKDAARANRLTLGSYIRTSLLEAPTTRSVRQPSADVEALTRLQGEMNKVGSNIHQLLRHVNFGETPPAEDYREALAGYREVVGAILEALGRGAGRV